LFQAEDGIRDYKVSGVQTCALPISGALAGLFANSISRKSIARPTVIPLSATLKVGQWREERSQCGSNQCQSMKSITYPRRTRSRSEERRVGKERRRRESASEAAGER